MGLLGYYSKHDSFGMFFEFKWYIYRLFQDRAISIGQNCGKGEKAKRQKRRKQGIMWSRLRLDRLITKIRAKRRDRIEVIYNQLYFDKVLWRVRLINKRRILKSKNKPKKFGTRYLKSQNYRPSFSYMRRLKISKRKDRKIDSLLSKQVVTIKLSKKA
jgi:hypothetical protein